jgi:uncharacterized phage-associated protein
MQNNLQKCKMIMLLWLSNGLRRAASLIDVWRNKYANRSTRTETPRKRDWPSRNGSQDSDGRDAGHHEIGPGAIRQGGREGAGGRVDAGTPVGDCQGGGEREVGVMAYKAVEVANEFLRQPGAMSSLTQMHLQKLAFIANGFNLVINDDDLVSDVFEAWDLGPVSPDLRDHTEFFGKKPIGRLLTSHDKGIAKFFPIKNDDTVYAANLSSRERDLIGRVYRKYGHLDGITLSKLTHQPGTPWHKAYQKGRNTPISRDDIVTHYNEIAASAAA